MKLLLNFLFCRLWIILVIFNFFSLKAQDRIELNSGWKCKKASETNKKGEEISSPSFSVNKWMDAVVPGTVLTTQLQNHLIPDPYISMGFS